MSYIPSRSAAVGSRSQADNTVAKAEPLSLRLLCPDLSQPTRAQGTLHHAVDSAAQTAYDSQPRWAEGNHKRSATCLTLWNLVCSALRSTRLTRLFDS